MFVASLLQRHPFPEAMLQTHCSREPSDRGARRVERTAAIATFHVSSPRLASNYSRSPLAIRPNFFNKKSFNKHFRGYPRPSQTSLFLLSLPVDPPRPQKPSRNLVEHSKETRGSRTLPYHTEPMSVDRRVCEEMRRNSYFCNPCDVPSRMLTNTN